MKIKHEEDHWLSVSDLMAGLMMIFLLISIMYMIQVESDKKHIKEVVVVYNHLKNDLYEDLLKEFESDLDDWGAEIHKDLTVRFNAPSILFDTGSDELNSKFKSILDNFFPRYIRLITSEKYIKTITEIRIEGHTSSIWKNSKSSMDAYFLNMKLSQERTRSTLQYVLNIENIQDKLSWLKQMVTANGLSSSKLIYDAVTHHEDIFRSQRVEFKIKNNSEEKLVEILEL